MQNVFPYIGADPVTGFLEGLDVLDDKGYIRVDGHMRTSVPGLYGAGDVTDKFLRQIVTAVSDGAVAAQDALHIIRSRTDTFPEFLKNQHHRKICRPVRKGEISCSYTQRKTILKNSS